MTDERFLNSYHNASTQPSQEVPEDLAGCQRQPKTDQLSASEN